MDDGSNNPLPETLSTIERQALARVDIVRLRRNLGHQRAIAIGLSYIREHRSCRGVVIMDGDGEDTPDGLFRLLDFFEENDEQFTVFAARARRMESSIFKFCYFMFKLVHRLLIGRLTRVGNFSVVPPHHLNRLVVVSEIWNHYAAAVFKARVPHKAIPIDRGECIAGSSKMNYTSLITHGLSAISVFGDTVGIRLLAATGVLALLAAAGMATVVTIRLATDLAIPGWATMAAGGLVIVLLQAFQASLLFVFVILQSRAGGGFLPIRDYTYYIENTKSATFRG